MFTLENSGSVKDVALGIVVGTAAVMAVPIASAIIAKQYIVADVANELCQCHRSQLTNKNWSRGMENVKSATMKKGKKVLLVIEYF